jgi:hypothetical protein
MEQKYEAILPTQEQPFTYFKLDLEPEDKECLANFKIEKQDELSGVVVIKEKETGHSRGFGLMTFAEKAQALSAVISMQ